MDELLKERSRTALINGQSKETGLWKTVETILEDDYLSIEEYRTKVREIAISIWSGSYDFQNVSVSEYIGFKDQNMNKMWKNSYGAWNQIWFDGEWTT